MDSGLYIAVFYLPKAGKIRVGKLGKFHFKEGAYFYVGSAQRNLSGRLKRHSYANSQILMQHDGNHNADKYFYLHDRLGSVRLVINDAADVNNCYTYKPFGELYDTETQETIDNPFKFTGQFFDDEIDEYYLRARMYDPHIGRFTSRDPVRGKFKEPSQIYDNDMLFFPFLQNNIWIVVLPKNRMPAASEGSKHFVPQKRFTIKMSNLGILNRFAEKAVNGLNIRSYKKWLISVRCFVSCAYGKLTIMWVEKRQPKLQPFYI